MKKETAGMDCQAGEYLAQKVARRNLLSNITKIGTSSQNLALSTKDFVNISPISK